MNRKLICTLAIISFTLCGCQNNNITPDISNENFKESSTAAETSEITTIPEITTVESTTIITSPPIKKSPEEQISVLADKLPEIISDFKYIMVTDLDGNGRLEVLLSEPGTSLYEINETCDDINKTAHFESMTAENPKILPLQENTLVLTDALGVRHYLWSSHTPADAYYYIEYENEYIYSNGKLECNPVRSRYYDFQNGWCEVPEDYEPLMSNIEYADSMKYFLTQKNSRLQKLSMDYTDSILIQNETTESIAEILKKLWSNFSVKDENIKYTIDNLEGSWISVSDSPSGPSEDSESEESEKEIILTFTDGYASLYEYDNYYGESYSEEVISSPETGNIISNTLWYVKMYDLGEFSYANATILSDGRLYFNAEYKDTTIIPSKVEWILQKVKEEKKEEEEEEEYEW